MRNPVSRVLVINDEALVLKDLIKGLNSAAKALDNPLGVTFTGVATAREALKAIEGDGDLQAVVVDDTLYTLANGKSSRRSLQMTALSLVQKITRFRPELDVYIMIAKEAEDEVVDALFSEAVDGYFARHRVKPGITGWAQISGWRGETDTHEKIQRRVEHDLYYIENWSVLFDLYILAATPLALITKTENAY